MATSVKSNEFGGANRNKDDEKHNDKASANIQVIESTAGESNPNLGELNTNLEELDPNLRESDPNLGESNPNLGELNSNLRESDPNLGESNPNHRESNTISDTVRTQKSEGSGKTEVAVSDTLTVQPMAPSSSELSQNIGSTIKVLEQNTKILVDDSKVKELELQSAANNPQPETCVEHTNTDQSIHSALQSEEVTKIADFPASTGNNVVTQLNQENVSEDEYGAADSVKETNNGKHKFKSEISVEDNVFDEGTKTQSGISPAAVSTKEKLNLTELGSSRLISRSLSEAAGKELHEGRPVREMLVRRSRTESTESASDKPVLETLTFGAFKNVETIKDEETKAHDVCLCLLCERSYPSDNKEDVLAHLVLMHKFVIADVNFIGNLPDYMRYWKKRFEEKPFSEFCSKIVTNVGVKDDASKEEFFLLCDALPEDKELRESLQRKKLKSVLAQQQKEREETKFCRQCLFCKQTFCGNRAVLIDHLVRDHSFHVGQPDNLVFTDEMFDLIQSKIDSQLCLFCEKSFKDKASLKEHMRKKQHRKINPKHKEYDRFYIINYMEVGKNWQSLQSEDNRLIKSNEKSPNEEDDWSGWNAESESRVVCLFCDMSCVAIAELQEHMKEKHSFDLHDVSSKLQLNFYQKVKLINYIRRQVYHKTCYGCHQTFDGKDELLAHLDEFSDHIQNVPDNEIWDQPQYFFPTYEDDSLLCNLDDDDDDGASGDALGVMVIKEDIPVTDTILKDKKLCQDLLKA